MDKDTIVKDLIEKRREKLDKLIINLKTDTLSIKELIDIVSISDRYIEEIKKINVELDYLGFLNYHDKKYKKKLNKALELQKEILEKISKEKLKISKSIIEVGKKDKIVNNYILKRKESIFIDKNF